MIFKQLLEKLRTLRFPTLDKTKVLMVVASVLILINIIVLLVVITPGKNATKRIGLVETPLVENPGVKVPVQNIVETQIPTPIQVPNSQDQHILGSTVDQGMVVFSMVENGYSHLYVFEPGQPDLLRLTFQPWDDISPAFSPDGTKIAFSSRRNGYWDIYLMDLTSGKITQLTDTAAYDSSPSWSPDGNLIVFESYLNDNFDLFVMDLSTNIPGIQQITNNEQQDYDPNWSPDGKSIIFISTFNETTSIWKATIEDHQVRVEPIRVNTGINPSHPVWSPDGTNLVWQAENDQRESIYQWKVSPSNTTSDVIAEGELPTWSPDGQAIFASISHANESYFTAYSLPDGNLVYPVTSATGRLTGIDWSDARLVNPLPAWILSAQEMRLAPLYQLVITPPVEGLEDRFHLATLPEVNAPYPQLHDLADEPFQGLRERLKVETGWDVLANLQSAFVPLSDSPAPGIKEDWRYTGRAFNLNPIPMDIDWMFITLEPYGDQAFFHVYIRPLYQDGSMGAPVSTQSLGYQWAIR